MAPLKKGEVFVPWAKASKRSWQDDEARARPLKEFFAGKRLRDITPMIIEQFKQQRLKTKHYTDGTARLRL